MNEIQKENLRRWIAALRSKKYQQGRGSLWCDDNSFCCLGVSCEIEQIPLDTEKGRFFPVESSDERDLTYGWDCAPDEGWFLEKYGFEMDRHFTVPDFALTEEERGEDDYPSTAELISLNDDYKLSFDQIADILENEFLKV